MKTTRCAVIGAIALSFAFAAQSVAIEGLKLSVQSTNAVLSWPSTNGETYIVQYRPVLNTNAGWTTITNYFSAATGTNFTSLVGTRGSTNSGFYRVVRDGVHIYGITNGVVLHDEVLTPIEFALDSTDQIAGVTFYDQNNNPIIGASAQPFGDGNGWLLVWNTTMSFNGNYSIYAEIDLASNTPAVSVPVAVTVSNVISFPNYFSRVFGGQMWIYAETIPNAAYQIGMYDENTNYLGSFSDYADGGGYISFLWDLTDGQGHTFDSTNFYGVFTVDTSSLSNISPVVPVKSVNTSSPNFQTLSLTRKTLCSKIKPNGAHPNGGSPSSASANQLWVKEPTWTPNNNWVVAYGLVSANSAQNDTYMICGGPSGEYGGALGTLDPYGLNGNLSPGNSCQAEQVFTLQDESSRTNLLSYLADHRYENFYFFGHGNNCSISSYNGFTLTLDQIAYALVNVPFSYSYPGPTRHLFGFPITTKVTLDTTILHAAYHPYRFVFIDACNTGDGNFCEAFAVPAITVSTNYFAAAGVESRAFVGFKSWEINMNLIGWQAYSLMTGGFLGSWLSNQYDLQTIVATAKYNGFGSGAYMDSSVVIYGAYDLKRNTRTRP